MKTHLDLLSDRAADWVAQVGSRNATPSGELAARGWAICEELRRRPTGASAELIEAIESRLGPSVPTTAAIHGCVESATAGWNRLMNTLDREEENFEHVRRETRDVFFSVLDALILVEEAGGPAEERAAQQLFNAVVADLYALEPMADVAAELQRRGQGEIRLSDLLCTGVAGMFGGEVRQPAGALVEGVELEEPVEEFVPLAVWLQRGAGGARQQGLTLAALAKRLADVPAWYVKWSAQQLRLAVNAAAHELHVRVMEGNGGDVPSPAMDGWQVRVGPASRGNPATIKGGAAAITLPEKLDPTKFALQVRQPTASAEWADVFARVGA